MGRRLKQGNGLRAWWPAGALALAMAGMGCGASDATGDGSMTGSVSAPVDTGGAPGGAVSQGGVVAGAMPCDVNTVVKSRCQTCHGATPIGGAPISLVTLQDFQQTYTVRTTQALVGQTMKVYQLAQIRINGAMNTPKMPQGGQLAPADFTALNGWLYERRSCRHGLREQHDDRHQPNRHERHADHRRRRRHGHDDGAWRHGHGHRRHRRHHDDADRAGG